MDFGLDLDSKLVLDLRGVVAGDCGLDLGVQRLLDCVDGLDLGVQHGPGGPRGREMSGSSDSVQLTNQTFRFPDPQ